MEVKELLGRCEYCFNIERDFKHAVWYCNRIMKTEPDNREALCYKAMSLYELGKYTDALEVTKQGLDIYPENTTLHDVRKKAVKKITILKEQLNNLDKKLAVSKDESLINEKLHLLVKLDELDEAYEFFMSQDKHILQFCDYELMASKLSPEKAIDCLNRVVDDNIGLVDEIKSLFCKYELDLKKFKIQDLYLTWIDKIKSKNNTETCPECGDKIIPVIYGYPSPELMQKEAKGEVRLGGCVMNFHNPSHYYFYCEKCSKEFDMGIRGFEIRAASQLQREYITRKLSKLSSILNYNTVSRNILGKEMTADGLDGIEVRAFIEHLKDIGAIFVSRGGDKISFNENDIPKEKSYCDEGKYAAPRWLVYPELSVGTIGWRMGYGEDYALNEPHRGREFHRLFPQPRNWSVNMRKSKLRRFSFLGFLWDLEGKPKYSKITGDAIEVNRFITMDEEGMFRNDTMFFNSIQEAISASKSRLFGYYADVDEKELAEDWEALKYTVCLNACYYKFMENERLRKMLLETGDKCLVYDCDDEWGGEENLFGFALMELRDEIRRLYEHEDLIDWEYTEYLKNKNPYEGGTPQRDPNDRQSAEYKVIESTFTGASRYVRDVNLDERFASKYEIGQILLEKAFVDASDRIGGMVTTHRYLILSSYMADLSQFEEGTNWGLHTANRDSKFKVVDIFEVDGKTQILLLHLPNAFEGVFENKTDVEEEFIENERENFKKDLKKDVIKELAAEEWLERCKFPIGMNDEGEFF